MRKVAIIGMLALLTGGCAGDQLATGASQPAAVLAKAPDTMSGRWILAAPNAPTCGLNFTGTTAAREGRLAPEGGCPERFFLARRWTLNDQALTIGDEDNTALGEFSFAAGRFDGRSAADVPLTLSR
ncbi:MAG: AprI/Inh family metalloprotease inhibitor [Pseudolabrys sp.]|nr:AprI/Inh family metalloprotease inhibitor [Pseudolabrys sp.]